MTNFSELLRFELKKIFLSRITILSLAVSTGMLLGIALINYLVVSPYDRGVYEREAALEGRTLDDALLAELAEEAEESFGRIHLPHAGQISDDREWHGIRNRQ